MRFRAAVVAAAVLALAAPAAAHAAESELEYRYGLEGVTLGEAKLVDPESRLCIEIPEVADIAEAHAYRPRNNTRSSATFFKGDGCTGAFYTLRPGGKASERLLFRSVTFS